MDDLLGIVFTGLAHACFTASLQRVRVAVAAVAAALEPVYGIAAAWIIFGDRPTMVMLGGALLIISAGVLSCCPHPVLETREQRNSEPVQAQITSKTTRRIHVA